MKNIKTRYEFIRALDFLTLFGLICIILLFVGSTLDIALSVKSEVYTNMLANLQFSLR
ncbi:MAG TPA: hypothetical protein VIS27_12915 [Yeosuana sp.]